MKRLVIAIPFPDLNFRRVAVYLFVAAVLFFAVSPVLLANECATDYERSDYPHWGSSDEYADIRQETIANAVVSGLNVQNGRVVGGLWYDPFSGRNYQITDVKPDVDHLASLAWVHERGGACMTREQRRAIANDPINLWAVHPSANRQKGANVTGWLPANFGMCTPYLQQLKIVVEKYQLKMTAVDIETYNAAVIKCHDWRNGIKIEKAKNWFQRWFE